MIDILYTRIVQGSLTLICASFCWTFVHPWNKLLRKGDRNQLLEGKCIIHWIGFNYSKKTSIRQIYFTHQRQKYFRHDGRMFRNIRHFVGSPPLQERLHLEPGTSSSLRLSVSSSVWIQTLDIYPIGTFFNSQWRSELRLEIEYRSCKSYK